jgi:hypothetical protein
MSVELKPQPAPGDLLLGCKHRPDVYKSHVFRADMLFRRPDGSSRIARWLILCDRCFQRYAIQEGDPSKAPIGCERIWREEDPPIQYKETD